MSEHEGSLPPIHGLIPQTGPMCLLSRVLDHGPTRTECEVQVAGSALFAGADGRVPAFLALEYMAQCVAAHGGLLQRASGAAPRPGLLLGTRRLELHVDTFAPDDVLRAWAAPRKRAPAAAGAGDLVAFACGVRRGRVDEIVAEANLNVFVAESVEALYATQKEEESA